jgi:hypothetical protein
VCPAAVPQASRKAQEVLHGFEYLQCISEADGKRQQVRVMRYKAALWGRDEKGVCVVGTVPCVSGGQREHTCGNWRCSGLGVGCLACSRLFNALVEVVWHLLCIFIAGGDRQR